MLTLLRRAALPAVAAGAVGSIGLFLGQAQHAPLLVVIGFIVWILSPFAILAWAHLASARRSAPVRTTVSCLAIVITLASLAAYGRVIDVAPARAANAFRFVAVAPASWLLIAIVLAAAAFLSRRLDKPDA